MNKFLLSIVCVFTLLFLCSSCGHRRGVILGAGNKVTKNPPVTTFNAIDISVPIKAIITLKDSASPSVQLEGYENLLEHILVKVESNKLVVYSDRHWNISFGDEDVIIARITLPKLNSLNMKGSPDADIHGALVTDNFELDISGSSDVTIDSLVTNEFSASISGNGDVKVKGGTAKHASYEISGSGDIKAFPLKADETTARISGSGDAEVTALQKLSTRISGSGDIKYKGHPSISQHVSGSGSVTDDN